PLPAAEMEIEEIASLWESRPAEDGAPARRALRLTRRRASEEAFKRTAPASRVLHLATHGFVLAEDCAPPGEAPRESPLLLAGLALAGANQREAGPDGGRSTDGRPDAGGEDGILTAEEIGALDLRNVEWAVLSACETGVGPVRSGEGVLGLRRAFEVAGAGSLILSLFKVDDATTRAWMKGLYEARLGGADTAGSVRRAGLAILRARRERGLGTHPFYWSPFVAAGDWR
ncbi:MAG: CHAT domain-containing protein, partial [Candidatus Polarisedimenticolia bacterium]